MRAMFDAAVLSSSWLTGFTVCLSLIASIGAQNLYVLRQAVQGEHVRACVAWCVDSDALLVALGVAGMARLLAGAPTLALWLRLGGALFLLGYGLFRWGGLPKTEAFFGSVPGGLLESIQLGEEAGADVRLLTVLHFLRLIGTIISVPMLFCMVGAQNLG